MGDVGEGGQRADADILLVVNADAAHSVDPINGDQGLARPAARTDLDQHVTAARDDLGFRMRLAQGNGLFHRICFINLIQIIHLAYPP